jgi:hypothetical protein
MSQDQVDAGEVGRARRIREDDATRGSVGCIFLDDHPQGDAMEQGLGQRVQRLFDRRVHLERRSGARIAPARLLHLLAEQGVITPDSESVPRA